MSRHKHKNKIDIGRGMDIFSQGYSLQPKIINYFTIRLKEEESSEFYDWYHTTGRLVLYEGGAVKTVGRFTTAEDVAQFIITQKLK